MKKIRLILVITLVSLFAIVNLAGAQYAGYYMGTVYQVVNPNPNPANVQVSYYNANGNLVGTRDINGLAAGGSQLVRVPSQETTLSAGVYSAVVSSDQAIQVIVNEEYYPTGNTSSPVPPFASYEGVANGANTVYLTAVMYNYYNYYTEMSIMNTGAAQANVTIKYFAGEVGGQPTGSNYTETMQIPANATMINSQKEKNALGAASGTFAGRFLGSALVTSDQPLAIVVNQHNPSAHKLMTYNGTIAGSKQIAVPVHMRGYYGYYTATQILNLSQTENACVKLTYRPSGTSNVRIDGQAVGPVEVVKVIKPMMSLQRYDGATASASQSDLLGYSRFYGALTVSSVTGTYGGVTCSSQPDLAVQVNTESIPTGSSQGGSILGSDLSKASRTLSLPIVLSNFYGYYTSSQLMNATNGTITCQVSYTSGPESAVPGVKKTYTHTIAPYAMIDLYEGLSGAPRGDINTDPSWCASGSCRFLGSAVVTCNGNVVSFTNEEKDVPGKDSMYSWNDFNLFVD